MIAIKCRTKKRINFFSKEKDKSNTRNDTSLD